MALRDALLRSGREFRAKILDESRSWPEEFGHPPTVFWISEVQSYESRQ